MDEQRGGSGANGDFCFQSFFQYVPLIFAEKNSSIRNKPISNEYKKTLIICLTDTRIGNLQALHFDSSFIAGKPPFSYWVLLLSQPQTRNAG